MSEKFLTNLPALSAEEQKLLQMVDLAKEDLIKLTQKLIAIDSRVYDPMIYSDLSPIFSFAESEMKKLGLDANYFLCSHPNTTPNEKKQWPNLICKWNEGTPGKRLQFMGHLDVVPFTPEKWNRGFHPLEGKIINDRIHGRGAEDMKGGVASQMMAIKILKQSGVKIHGTLQMWFVPDEEIDGHYGARFMSSNHKDDVNCDATIIAEPTCQFPISSPVLIVGEKGSHWFRLKFLGAAGHGSMPKPRYECDHESDAIYEQY